VKANAKFPGRYSESNWRPIALEIGRVFAVPLSAPKGAIDHFYQRARDTLERLAQEYVAATTLRPKPPSLRRGGREKWTPQRGKFLERKRKQVMAIRRSIAEGGYHLGWGNSFEKAFLEIDRVLADEIETIGAFNDLYMQMGKTNRKRSSENATKAALDAYFGALADFWRRIGGAKKPPDRKTRALLVSFVQAAAKPVVMDKESLNREAIATRLRRIERPRKRQMA
jgi:hypothetical protein